MKRRKASHAIKIYFFLLNWLENNILLYKYHIFASIVSALESIIETLHT